VALLHDPVYTELSEKFAANPDMLTEEFGRAWYKLMTR
jgi:catalase (peroxidase I)